MSPNQWQWVVGNKVGCNDCRHNNTLTNKRVILVRGRSSRSFSLGRIWWWGNLIVRERGRRRLRQSGCSGPSMFGFRGRFLSLDLDEDGGSACLLQALVWEGGSEGGGGLVFLVRAINERIWRWNVLEIDRALEGIPVWRRREKRQNNEVRRRHRRGGSLSEARWRWWRQGERRRWSARGGIERERHEWRTSNREGNEDRKRWKKNKWKKGF